MSDARKTVFITGCSGPGIGRHLALAFAARNFRVFATARQASSIADLQEKGIETLSLTVDDQASVEACYKEVCALLGPGKGLDYLVNNAGRNYTTPALDTTLAEIQLTFATNLFSVMHINSTFIPLVLCTRGTVVHIGSVAGVLPYIWGSCYNASKAALHSYASTLRVELAPFGVHVLTVVTGGVRSDIARTKRTLPEGSLFEAQREQYEMRLTHSQQVGEPAHVYAESVLRGALSCRGRLWNRNEVWAGAKSRLVWWMATIDWWFPGGVWRFLVPRLVGLKSKIEVPQSKKRV